MMLLIWLGVASNDSQAAGGQNTHVHMVWLNLTGANF